MLNRPQPLVWRQKGHADAGGREEEAHQERVEHDEAEIVRPAPEPADLLRPPWRQHLPTAPSGQHARKQLNRMTGSAAITAQAREAPGKGGSEDQLDIRSGSRSKVAGQRPHPLDGGRSRFPGEERVAVDLEDALHSSHHWRPEGIDRHGRPSPQRSRFLPASACQAAHGRPPAIQAVQRSMF